MRPFECPKCGATDCFVEVSKYIGLALIEYIDADTGHIHWAGDTQYGDSEEHVGYECGNCDHTFTFAAFDPAARVADALRELDQITADLESD